MSTRRAQPGDASAGLGRYQLISRIATGGMAEIYVARMEGYAGSRRLCVIKKILPRIAGDPRAVQMFLDEARIAATLQHPNIVQMFEVGELEGTYFIAMEYLHGEDMRTVMRTLTRAGLRLPLELAVHVAVDLCAGLHYAHEKRGIDGRPLGIVHRDVSPHNLFVTYDGAVKIVDFGIAKAENREHQTKVETLKGKIHYMSPEQCRCIELDRRSDIYSVGVVLYELTTSRRLNSGNDEYEIMKRTVEGPLPRPSEHVRGYPAELESIIHMALEKRPEDRFQTALEMQQALENFAFEHRLKHSTIELSRFMHQLFSDRIESWQEGIRQGTSIRELVIARHQPEEGSEPTFEPAVDEPEPTVPLSEPETMPALAAGAAGARSSEKVAPLSGVLETLPGSEPELAATGPSRRWPILLAVLVLFAALGVAVGLKLRQGGAVASGPAPADAGLGDRAAETAIDAAVAVLAPDAAVPEVAPPPAVMIDAAVTPPAKPATLAIRGTAGARIFVDGARRGRAPARIAKLEPGRHVIELRKPGHQSERRVVELEAGETERLVIRLARARSSGARSGSGSASGSGAGSASGTAGEPAPVDDRPGSLRVASSPSCEVLVDGISRGFTATTVKLPPGAHRVRLVNGGAGIDTSLTVVIRPGEVHKVRCKAGTCRSF